MLCPRCYGKHVILMSASWVPCPECAGVGELHCCDGLREQGECAPATRAEPKTPLVTFLPFAHRGADVAEKSA